MTDKKNNDESQEAFGALGRSCVAQEVLERSWELTLAFGILLVIAGTMGMYFAVWTTLASVIMFGALLATGAILHAIEAFRGNDHRKYSRLENGMLALLYAVMAVVTFIDPISASMALTMMLTGFFIFTGVMRLFYAFKRKSNKEEVWLHVIMGVMNLALAAIVLWQWPVSSLLLIGLLVSIELLFSGWILVAAALSLRKLQTAETSEAQTPEEAESA
jgi:uncharacterized membrane protein HdeD (DUF308 family)